ncbi:hypothetical protein [Thalassotalea sp. ND16A]|uniref:hypothetical protein n=1 Tax=Thalassotalea sp. ND16A TaxID=1535422 RepID=UPI000519F674|nr:hypothetical protein [Thalassotalea sp. ND16A]KGJ95690.1 hypothetical protein ND16A_1225 [Thalassotalea sp. ND16A]
MDKISKSTTFTTVTILAVLLLGWRLRDEYWYTAEDGWGYAFGIIGGSMMILLLLYPVRKYWKPMKNAFKVRHWFRMHMLFGLWGPVFIMLHSNFSLGSLNSSIALVCMLLVAGSGLVGRYVYQKLHRGLYGAQIEFSELNADYQLSKDHFTETALFSTEVQDELSQIESQLTHKNVRLTASLAVAKRIKKIQKHSKVQAKELKAQAAGNKEQLALLILGIKHWDKGLFKLRKMANYALYTRLFALWHVFHYPFFLLMIITGIIHVFVVHIY